MNHLSIPKWPGSGSGVTCRRQKEKPIDQAVVAGARWLRALAYSMEYKEGPTTSTRTPEPFGSLPTEWITPDDASHKYTGAEDIRSRSGRSGYQCFILLPMCHLGWCCYFLIRAGCSTIRRVLPFTHDQGTRRRRRVGRVGEGDGLDEAERWVMDYHVLLRSGPSTEA